MNREAIEFHDSVLARIERGNDQLTLFLEPAYVHRSGGEPTRDAGTGWSVNVALTVSNAHVGEPQPKLPSRISDGTLRIDDREFENVVPLPFTATGAVDLSIEITTGEVLRVSGKGVEFHVVGAYKFVEDVAAV